ncbi:hypothetical protein SAMN05444817_101165 [Corynebacterium appendicis CIP 107643]|uniref:Uncharacterized protein n=1 Tax=Corynebacterium appendicis CIP 107643 TaxID=1161099 RepID=A0A1N7IP14_9CORY|nr:hypothetical protein [Corynebacterium appendicis]WJY60081.1 hypothetical protein CAPP_00640 [Corynebacterium appendicis CIP 107643]SIS38843.1 hypothetical protein SAMN05444817_101165 [Corynebacterium appendicis CIP 107643]
MSEHDAAGSRAGLSPHASSVWLPVGTQRTVLIDASPTPFPSSDGTPAVVEVCFDPAGDVVARMDGEILGAFDAEASAALRKSPRRPPPRTNPVARKPTSPFPLPNPVEATTHPNHDRFLSSNGK